MASSLSARKLAVLITDGYKAPVRGLPACRASLALELSYFDDGFCIDRLDDRTVHRPCVNLDGVFKLSQSISMAEKLEAHTH